MRFPLRFPLEFPLKNKGNPKGKMKGFHVLPAHFIPYFSRNSIISNTLQNQELMTMTMGEMAHFSGSTLVVLKVKQQPT